ncbi:MAG: retropepsin-like domain-containing protein [Leadbetterella sp.]|nr:retropepsin-like domain-containing protein [Leadbetterella sp.]
MSFFLEKPLKSLLIFFFLFVKTINTNAQETKIDTIPFSLDKKLIVFKGKINGQEIDFAFDTGAQSGVANSKNVEKAAIKTLGKGTKIKDSNQVLKKIESIEVQDLQIGNFNFSKIKDYTIDMPYLYCADLYLLGQTVIKKLNWQFDFEKMLVYISKSPFKENQNSINWPITSYKGNRPHVNFELGGKVFKNLLVDTGYTSVLELDSTYSIVRNAFLQKQNIGQGYQVMASTMGLMGFGKPSLTKEFRMDSIKIGNTLFKDVPIIINPGTDNKVGITFFSDLCRTFTINFSTNNILLDLKNQSKIERSMLDAKVAVKEGKFIIIAKTIGENSSSSELDINEEVLTLNGKKVNDFADECEFLLWFYLFKENQMIIEKLNGEKITLKRMFVD